MGAATASPRRVKRARTAAWTAQKYRFPFGGGFCWFLFVTNCSLEVTIYKNVRLINLLICCLFVSQKTRSSPKSKNQKKSLLPFRFRLVLVNSDFAAALPAASRGLETAVR